MPCPLSLQSFSNQMCGLPPAKKYFFFNFFFNFFLIKYKENEKIIGNYRIRQKNFWGFPGKCSLFCN